MHTTINEPETMDLDRDLTLNCIIWGEYSSQVFQVTIDSSKSIDSLKQAIKAKRPATLQGVVNENIKVYIENAIPIPIDLNDIEDNRKFEDNVFRVCIGRQRGRLQKLSEIFRDKLDDQDLHVILDVPQLTISLRLSCIVQSEDDVFEVNIDRRSKVIELEEAIKQLTGSPSTWSPLIWSVDGFSEKIKETDFEEIAPFEELAPLELLTHCFPIKPNPNHLQIIVQKGLSKSDFLKLCPPPLGYINVRKSTQTTVPPYGRMPQSVVIWDHFKDDVNNVIWDDVQTYSLPLFEKYPKISNEMAVRAALDENVFCILNVMLEQDEECRYFSRLGVAIGEPAFIQTSQVLHLVIEVKTKWDLPVDDLVTTYDQNLSEHQEETTSVYNQVRQIFGYLSHNCLRYGALTTYDKTWFLFRPPNNPGQLCISPAIQCDDQQPTLFQCLHYVTSLARTEYDCSPAPSSPIRPQFYDSNPSPDGGDDAPIAGGRSRVKTRPSHPLNRDDNHVPLDFFDWDSFRVLDVLGYGRSGTTFKAVLHGEMVALKICDLWQHPGYNEELLNEVKVYHALEDLQGDCIPRLKGAGYTAGGLFAIATDIVGRPLKDRESLPVSDEECLAIQRALSSIHRHGFVHGDIRKENILIKRNDDEFYTCFVDFTFSKKGGWSDFRKEKNTLALLLEQL